MPSELRPLIVIKPFQATLLCVLLASVAGVAQEPLASTGATIRTDVPLVLLPVTVTDSHGKPINGLKDDDFYVSDEGVKQKIRVDTADTLVAPVSLVVAVQTSWISQPALSKIQEVGGIIRPLVAGDGGYVAVMAYDTEVRTLTGFTVDSAAVENTFSRLRARSPKDGILLDAVSKGVSLLRTRPQNNRKILILIGESRDRGSKESLLGAVQAAQREGVIVYSITYSAQKTAWTVDSSNTEPPPLPPSGPNYIGGFGELFRLTKQDVTDQLARATGGRKTSFALLSGLENALTNIGQEIHGQYLLSFAPLEMDEVRFRRVQVKVPTHPGAIVRARPGYWPK